MNYDPISRFLGRVKTASTGGSKDIRLTIEEAAALAAAIGLLTVEIAKAQNTGGDIIVKMDGGSF